MATTSTETKQGVHQVTDRLRETQYDLRRDLEKVRAAAAETMTDQFGEVRNLTEEYVEAGRECAIEYEQQVENQIREKPVQSTLIAAGIGFVAGLLLFRR